jgi:xanthine dehydrogenase large subunit
MLEILPEHSCLPHDSSHLHVAGTSVFIDDRPLMDNELHVGLVLSPHAKARIKSIDISKASRLGAVCLLAKDVAHNLFGSIICEEPLIADGEVNYVGQVVAVVAACNISLLKEALKLVEVTYEKMPAILSIDEAIKKSSYIIDGKKILKGDPKLELEKAPHKLSGKLSIKGAEHFYLENQAAIAYPKEDGFMEVHSSTQHPSETQSLVAEALGIQESMVVCITKRLGGGFGGKETQAAPFAAYAALVAKHTGRPSRIVLSKDEDMQITGKRNPYQVNYEVGFDDRGLVRAIDLQFYGDGGAYADLSTSILERAMLHADNAYFLPHVQISGVVCRTNYHPHTAFRGFGGPKGVAVIEHVMESIAQYLQIDALEVRKANCYQNEKIHTPYGQEVENNLLPELFSTLEKRCDYYARRSNLEKWNKDQTKTLRGMSMTAIKFGISFTARFLNQAHALIHIFRDGSVQVATGAVEMGQGVQARIKKLVADVFGIDPSVVHILPTATDKNANTSPTAASSGTDLNGSAAVIASLKIKAELCGLFKSLIDLPKEKWPQTTARLGTAPEFVVESMLDPAIIFEDSQIFYRDQKEQSMSFVELINAAYLNRISLSAHGYYKVPDVSFDKISGKGSPFLYFTQGVACSEVEINRLTGEAKILRTDILMDMGNPINFALDKGQISGGFVQGAGWILSENLVYDQEGKLLTHAPSTYKIPSIHDMPRIFNIELVKNTGNTKNLSGTKASGEPPLMLCFAVWNAVKNALAYEDRAKSLACLPIPATSEVILKHLENLHKRPQE